MVKQKKIKFKLDVFLNKNHTKDQAIQLLSIVLSRTTRSVSTINTKVIVEGVVTLVHHKPEILNRLKDSKVELILKMAEESSMLPMEFESDEEIRESKILK